MIPFLFGTKTKVKPKKNGQQVRRFCPDCEHNATFVEADVAHALTVFGAELVSLGDEDTYVCEHCDACMYLSATKDPQLEGPTKDRPKGWGIGERLAAKRQARAEQKAEFERAEALAEKIEADKLAAEEAERAKQSALDDELAELKAKLGL